MVGVHKKVKKSLTNLEGCAEPLEELILQLIVVPNVTHAPQEIAMQENEQSRFVRLTALLAILAMLLAISNLAIPSIFAIGLGGVLLLIPI